jgi:hypothetical protein
MVSNQALLLSFCLAFRGKHCITARSMQRCFVQSFDDSNTERLRAAMANRSSGYDFGFDPLCVDWDDYFYRVHIPGVVKYLCGY